MKEWNIFEQIKLRKCADYNTFEIQPFATIGAVIRLEYQNLKFLSTHPAEYDVWWRNVFRTQTNIYDGAFLGK